jgi:hypothetical protein
MQVSIVRKDSISSLLRMSMLLAYQRAATASITRRSQQKLYRLSRSSRATAPKLS